MVDQLNPGYGPGPEPIPQQALMLLSVSIDNIMSFNIDVCVITRNYKFLVVMNDYRHHLRGEEGGVFIKELPDSHVGRACNDCNGSAILHIS